MKASCKVLSRMGRHMHCSTERCIFPEGRLKYFMYVGGLSSSVHQDSCAHASKLQTDGDTFIYVIKMNVCRINVSQQDFM